MISKTIVTCPVELLFAQLDKPARFKDKADSKLRFNVKVRLDPSNSEQAKLLAELHDYEQACFTHEKAELEKKIAEGGKDSGKLKALLKQLEQADSKVPAELDKDTAEETGKFVMNIGRLAEGTKKDGTPWTLKSIPIFDAGNPPKEIKDVAGLKLGRGSIVCLKIELQSYLIEGQKTAGMTAKLLGAQVRKLVQFGGGGASADDFGSAEDGFVATPAEQGSSDFAPGGEDSDDIPL
jgi:hypothetical protein